MRSIIVLLFAFLFVTSCDDGDVITVDLEFGEDLGRCNDNDNFYLLYNTRTDPSESLTILLPRSTQVENIFREATTDSIEVDMSSVRFNYRTYNRNISGNELCNLVPPADLRIIEDYEAANGAQIIFISTIEDDDLDGIPSDDEGRGAPDEDGNFPDAQDTDNDGIPDYLDQDDDNDNVLTEDELDKENIDGDDNPLTNPLNTDLDIEIANNEDPVPNYLDNDDDGDGVLTIDEDINGENGPTDDTSASPINGDPIPFYLDSLETQTTQFQIENIENTYKRFVTTNIFVKNFSIDILQQDELFFGTFVNDFDLPED